MKSERLRFNAGFASYYLHEQLLFILVAKLQIILWILCKPSKKTYT